MQKPINECASQSTIVDRPAAGKDRPSVAKDLLVPRQIIEPTIGRRDVIHAARRCAKGDVSPQRRRQEDSGMGFLLRIRCALRTSVKWNRPRAK
jgi:hypothetical protein